MLGVAAGIFYNASDLTPSVGIFVKQLYSLFISLFWQQPPVWEFIYTSEHCMRIIP